MKQIVGACCNMSVRFNRALLISNGQAAIFDGAH